MYFFNCLRKITGQLQNYIEFPYKEAFWIFLVQLSLFGSFLNFFSSIVLELSHSLYSNEHYQSCIFVTRRKNWCKQPNSNKSKNNEAKESDVKIIFNIKPWPLKQEKKFRVPADSLWKKNLSSPKAETNIFWG